MDRNNKGQFIKGIIPHNKGKHLSKELKKKLSVAAKTNLAKGMTMPSRKGIISPMKGKHNSLLVNEKNGNWKGKEVGYWALHDWVQRRLGTPSKCDFCKTTENKRYEWANKSHEYKREITDWLRLCKSCHKKYDIAYKKNKRHNIKYGMA